MLGSARQQFLAAAAPAPADDDLDLVGGLEAALKLLQNPAQTEALAKKALEAAKQVKAARKTLADLEDKQRKAEASIAAATTEVAKLRAGHDATVSAAAKEIAAMKKGAADLQAEAEALMARAKEQHDAIRRKINAYDAA
jgi:chromosome segregation ATPase